MKDCEDIVGDFEEFREMPKLFRKLNKALSREYFHWNFYTYAAIVATGLHREEFQEFFLKEATGEATHINEFGNLLISLGVNSTFKPHKWNPSKYKKTDVKSLLKVALKMEQKVVEKYTEILQLADTCVNAHCRAPRKQDKIDATYIRIFLEDQIMDSRKAVDHISQLLKD